MITVVTTNRHPLLGHIHGDTADSAHIVPTGLGAAVIALFYDIEKQVLDRTGKTIQIVQYQLMPDHFHGVIYVRDPLPAGWQLGRIIAGWKGACSRAFWQRHLFRSMRRRQTVAGRARRRTFRTIRGRAIGICQGTRYKT